MFISALLTSSLASRLKDNAKQSAKAAFRTKVLFDTNQLLQQSSDKEKIISACANQIIKLLGKDVVFYQVENDRLSDGKVVRDETINKYLENWDLDRLGKTDRAILRLSTYEMMYYDTPKVVVINEAVELAKKYSDDKVVKLINAVLDKVRDNEEVNE